MCMPASDEESGAALGEPRGRIPVGLVEREVVLDVAGGHELVRRANTLPASFEGSDLLDLERMEALVHNYEC